MRIYDLYIDDARQLTLCRVAILAGDDERARQLAKREMETFSHYRGVELRAGNVRLCALGTLQDAEVSTREASDGRTPNLSRR